MYVKQARFTFFGAFNNFKETKITYSGKNALDTQLSVPLNPMSPQKDRVLVKTN